MDSTAAASDLPSSFVRVEMQKVGQAERRSPAGSAASRGGPGRKLNVDSIKKLKTKKFQSQIRRSPGTILKKEVLMLLKLPRISFSCLFFRRSLRCQTFTHQSGRLFRFLRHFITKPWEGKAEKLNHQQRQGENKV